MNQVRIWGNPFGEDAAASLLRSFLRLSLGSGMQCALSLSGMTPGPVQDGEREIPLTDGVRDLRVGTRLPPAEIDLLLRAAGEATAATAPVVVFADEVAMADALTMAGLEWPKAAIVLAGKVPTTAPELLERVRAELRWAGSENPPHALSAREFASWRSLPPVGASGPIVHVGASAADGTDLVVSAWMRHFQSSGHGLRLVVGDASDDVVAELRARFAAGGSHAVEIVRAAFEPAHVRDAAAIVLPMRELRDSRTLVLALASGRPVCVSKWAAVASIVDRPGICHAIGGRLVPDEGLVSAHFEPHPRALLAALKAAIGDAATGRRARQYTVEELTTERPAAPPLALASLRSARPTVVLEAPFFETSSSAELSIATAQALVRRGQVDLQLVPTVPLHGSLASLRARAPELVPLLRRNPANVDLWLSSGWPVRAARPACRSFALRVDWEYGALPLELTPHVPQEADTVVVHSEHVCRAVTAAGRPLTEIAVVPHGVDAAMHEAAVPDAEITAWKGGLPAVLFCGGLIWRKGFDVFLRTVLAARQAGAEFCVVLKTVGHDRHYGRFHLGELVERFRRTPGTPPLLLVDRDLTRAQLASLYTACDVLVHPYRGEGFCLPVLEARACGLPVLATAGGATDPLMAGIDDQRIPSLRRDVELPGAHVSQPWILEPSADDAAALLVTTLQELPQRQAAAVRFAAAVRAAYTWDAAAVALEQLAAAAMGRRQLPIPARQVLPAVEPLVTLPSAPGKVPAATYAPVADLVR